MLFWVCLLLYLRKEKNNSKHTKNSKTSFGIILKGAFECCVMSEDCQRFPN